MVDLFLELELLVINNNVGIIYYECGSRVNCFFVKGSCFSCHILSDAGIHISTSICEIVEDSGELPLASDDDDLELEIFPTDDSRNEQFTYQNLSVVGWYILTL